MTCTLAWNPLGVRLSRWSIITQTWPGVLKVRVAAVALTVSCRRVMRPRRKWRRGDLFEGWSLLLLPSCCLPCQKELIEDCKPRWCLSVQNLTTAQVLWFLVTRCRDVPVSSCLFKCKCFGQIVLSKLRDANVAKKAKNNAAFPMTVLSNKGSTKIHSLTVPRLKSSPILSALTILLSFECHLLLNKKINIGGRKLWFLHMTLWNVAKFVSDLYNIRLQCWGKKQKHQSFFFFIFSLCDSFSLKNS